MAADRERLWAEAAEYAALAARLRVNCQRDYAGDDDYCRTCATIERMASESLASARAAGAAAAREPGLVTPQADRDCVFIDRIADPSAASPAGTVVEVAA